MRDLVLRQTRRAILPVLAVLSALLAGRPATAHHDENCGAGPSDGIEFCPWEWSLGLAAAAERFGDRLRAGPHLFLGFPIPIPPSRSWLTKTRFFVEPYYRPAFLFDGAGEHTAFHELGVLVKVWSMRTHYED